MNMISQDTYYTFCITVESFNGQISVSRFYSFLDYRLSYVKDYKISFVGPKLMTESILENSKNDVENSGGSSGRAGLAASSRHASSSTMFHLI